MNAHLSDSARTLKEIRSFEVNSEYHIEKIYRELLRGDYSFAKGRGTLIPRQKKSPRPIVIADIRDRIVQRSLLKVTTQQPSVKSLIDHKSSFGGLEDKGVRHAIEAVYRAYDSGARYYLKTDIKDFYRHIPREEALKRLCSVLKDSSLNELLYSSTLSELANLQQFSEEELKLFPTGSLGVAQGCCLSPLLGNVILREFDDTVNTDGVVCLRYIDDLLFLAETMRDANRAFKRGLKVLTKLGLSTYYPGDGSGKSSEGTTKKGFDYLGCSISPGFVQPSREAINKFMNRIADILKDGEQHLLAIQRSGALAYQHAMLQTLILVGQVIRAWANQYSFCNGRQAMEHLDQRIDELIGSYISKYSTLYRLSSPDTRRRLMGVQMISDCAPEPIKR